MSRSVNHKERSTRLVHWDYTRGTFFVTVVTKNRAQVLSEIVDGRVRLTDAGRIVEEEWRAIAPRRPHVVLDRFVIMPDHFQALVRLMWTGEPGTSKEEGPLLPRSLSAVIGGFKSGSARRIRQECLPDFAWQSGFHDRLIRNRGELERKRQYIQANPKEWANAHPKTPVPPSHPHWSPRQGR